MSDPYVHDRHKFADAGLQLRLPVDLIPANQYARLTNALTIVEGQLVPRAGLSLISQISLINTLIGLSGSGTSATAATTVSPHFLYAAASVQIEVDTVLDGSSISLQTYNVTIMAVPTPTTFTFTPAIPVTYNSGSSARVIGRVIAANLNPAPALHTIFRLNQSLASTPTQRILGLGAKLFQQAAPDGAFYEILVTTATGAVLSGAGLSGSPLAITSFRFTRDAASWAIIANQNAMYKYRPSSTSVFNGAYFEPLGNAPPTVAATASAGGVGNLNSTGGTGYDWRYTYVDGATFSESNPSPILLMAGGNTTQRPTAFVNPYPSSVNVFNNPNNAIDGSATTAATASVFNAAPKPGGLAVVAGCLWNAISPTLGITNIQLNVVAALSASSQTQGTHGLFGGTASIQYSYDGGITWQTLVSVKNSTLNKQTFSAVIPNSVSLANLYIQSNCVAEPIIPGLDGSGNSASVSIFDINLGLTVTPETETLSLVNQSANVCVTPSPFYWHRYINLYRRGGSLTDTWRFVGQFDVTALTIGGCGAGMLQINDNISDTELSTQSLLQLDNDQPVTSVNVTNQALPFIWGPTNNAQLLGCGDPARPECVYWCKNGNADAWPPQNFVEVSDPGTPIIAGCTYGTRNFAFSRERMFELVFGLGTGSDYSPFDSPVSRGLISPWGLCVGREIYFVSKDGVYATDGGPEQSLIDDSIKPLFPTKDSVGENVNGYEAVDLTKPDLIRLEYHNDEVWFIYPGQFSGIQRLLVYDLTRNRWRSAQYSNQVSTLYSEGNTISSLLAGTASGGFYQTGGNVDPTTMDVLSSVIAYSSVNAGVTLSAGNYYVRVSRFDSNIESALSVELGPIVVNSNHAIQVQLPAGNPNTTSWRVYYSTSSGRESQYLGVQESALPDARTFNVAISGTAGSPSTSVSGSVPLLISTGAHDQGDPLNRKEYGNVIFDVNPGGAELTIMPLLNAEEQPQSAITIPADSGRQQVPLTLGDVYGFNIEFTITANTGTGALPTLYQYDILHRLDPVGVKHWEGRESALQQVGYFHIRDLYVAVRSTAVITLTLTIDGNQQIYSIPSTAGLRRKLYVPLGANKGKLYHFSFDSPQEFRLYSVDCETRAKTWITVMGYQIVSPFGSELSSGGGLNG